MERLIVTIEGSTAGPLEAIRTFEGEAPSEFLAIEGKDVLQLVFRDLDGAVTVEVCSRNESIGIYTLVTGSDNKIVLAKGDAESVQRQLSLKCQKH
ncbi:hypothetical protein G9G39_00275 [Cronobacter sp. EKM101R]|uniref:hypothetical protein n=1 Tax=unclassified Cronobacter TaxID=2649764 RepID=UPI0013EB1A49|nr:MULTISPECIES: hypothetical protein [unclassified Cronobacter]KAF6597555.1 hypothetical protein G9G39_00275 [Cronobacter sp. EKM101R]KAF6598537.1 hypothetical protein G9G38_10055 [Cronobacter sp. EKM102R]